MPRISFVLPTHNRIAWVGECLQSLIDQTEPDIEIIVVDDNSQDGTKEFLDEWATQDPRVKVVHNQENLGAGRSRNIGMELASSPIIAICDDDDFYPEDRASITLKWFEENPEGELVNFPYIRVGYFGEHLENFYGSQFDEKAFKENGTVSYFSNPTVAYKKESALQMGGYPSETDKMTDDIQFVNNWIGAGKKIGFDNRAFACLHRVLPSSMMAKQRGWSPKWVGAK
jgi:glycosyltransferase involved in cell wall biosynthesis